MVNNMKKDIYDKLDSIIDESYRLMDMIEKDFKSSLCTTDVLPADTIRANNVIRRVIGDLKTTKQYLKDVENTNIPTSLTDDIKNIKPIKTVQINDIDEEKLKSLRKIFEDYEKSFRRN